MFEIEIYSNGNCVDSDYFEDVNEALTRITDMISEDLASGDSQYAYKLFETTRVEKSFEIVSKMTAVLV